jgi:hypothetical protein
MGISKDKEQKKEKEKKLALTSFAEEEKILQDNVNNLYA